MPTAFMPPLMTTTDDRPAHMSLALSGQCYEPTSPMPALGSTERVRTKLRESKGVIAVLHYMPANSGQTFGFRGYHALAEHADDQPAQQRHFTAKLDYCGEGVGRILDTENLVPAKHDCLQLHGTVCRRVYGLSLAVDVEVQKGWLHNTLISFALCR